MNVEIQKWGNSAAVRLPSVVLRDVGLSIGQSMNLTVDSGKLVLVPQHGYRLEDLVAAVNSENCHELLIDSRAKGNEFW